MLQFYLFVGLTLGVITACVIVIASIQVKRFYLEPKDRETEQEVGDLFEEKREDIAERFEAYKNGQGFEEVLEAARYLEVSNTDLLYLVQLLLYQDAQLGDTRKVETVEDLGYHLIYMDRLEVVDWQKYNHLYFSDVEIYANEEGHIGAVVSMTGDEKGFDKNGVHIGEEVEQKGTFLCPLEGGQPDALDSNLRDLIQEMSIAFGLTEIMRHDFLFSGNADKEELKFVADALDKILGEVKDRQVAIEDSAFSIAVDNYANTLDANNKVTASTYKDDFPVTNT